VVVGSIFLLVGYARKDKASAAKAVATKMKGLIKPIITKDDIKRLEALEAVEAKRCGLEEFKCSTNEEMLQIMGLVKAA